MRNLLLLLLMTLLVSCEKSKLPTPFHAIDVSWRYAEKPCGFPSHRPQRQNAQTIRFQRQSSGIVFWLYPLSRNLSDYTG
jgi:hypothetical protein